MADDTGLDPRTRPFEWQTKPTRGVVLGQRCRVDNDRDRTPADFDSFMAKFGQISVWPVGRDKVVARAYKGEGVEIVELSGARKVASPEDLDLLRTALKQARQDITSALNTDWDVRTELRVATEFAFVTLPQWLASNLAAGVIDAALSLPQPSVVTLIDEHLAVGPAKEGALKTLHDYLDVQFRAARRGEILDRIGGSSPMHAPWTLVALLLGTWLFRLEPLTLLIAAAAMTVPIVILAFQARATGWRLYLQRAGALTAIALYSIALFGVAYGACALANRAHNPAAAPEPLGNAFLIATSMGLAGGVVGDALSGAALRVAHVQLLLFLGGLTALLARVLRIEALLSARQ